MFWKRKNFSLAKLFKFFTSKCQKRILFICYNVNTSSTLYRTKNSQKTFKLKLGICRMYLCEFHLTIKFKTLHQFWPVSARKINVFIFNIFKKVILFFVSIHFLKPSALIIKILISHTNDNNFIIFSKSSFS